MAGSGTAHLRDTDDVLVRVENMVVEFPISGGTVHAVSDVSFDLVEGETLGIVGESGCGKSTTARAAIQLPQADVRFGLVQGHGPHHARRTRRCARSARSSR